MPLERIVRSLSVASCAVLLIEEKTNDEGKKIKKSTCAQKTIYI